MPDILVVLFSPGTLLSSLQWQWPRFPNQQKSIKVKFRGNMSIYVKK